VRIGRMTSVVAYAHRTGNVIPTADRISQGLHVSEMACAY